MSSLTGSLVVFFLVDFVVYLIGCLRLIGRWCEKGGS